VAAVSRRTGEQQNGQIHWMNQQEGRAFFEEQARKLLGISGEEFLRRWEAGEYDELADDPEHPEILRLATLIPFAR
jgi:hypothetical protein